MFLFRLMLVFCYYIITPSMQSVLSRPRFVWWSPPPLLFNGPSVDINLKVPNHICLEVICYPFLKPTRKFLHEIKAFPNFSFACFHWKITWHLRKVNKKVKGERVSNWIDAQSSCLGFTSFNLSLCLLSKTTDKLLLYNLYHFMYGIQKRLFIEAHFGPFFTKYAHCKPLFLSQNIAK